MSPAAAIAGPFAVGSEAPSDLAQGDTRGVQANGLLEAGAPTRVRRWAARRRGRVPVPRSWACPPRALRQPSPRPPPSRSAERWRSGAPRWLEGHHQGCAADATGPRSGPRLALLAGRRRRRRRRGHARRSPRQGSASATPQGSQLDGRAAGRGSLAQVAATPCMVAAPPGRIDPEHARRRAWHRRGIATARHAQRRVRAGGDGQPRRKAGAGLSADDEAEVALQIA